MRSANNTAKDQSLHCCIAGGGPAGMMFGFLLARAGVKVLVLEKHNDFFRDFRGDTIHPSTLELMFELGLLEEFLKVPHQELHGLAGQIGNETIPLADFSHLPTKCKFLAFMPQWDFLDFLADHAKAYPAFELLMDMEVIDLVFDGDKVAGVKVTGPNGPSEIRADLTIGADGRQSIVRERAGLKVEELGAPIDVLWFRISRKPEDPGQVLGRFTAGKIMVMLNREDYWQCGFVIQKFSFEKIKQRGLDQFRQDIIGVAPFLENRVAEIIDWDQIKLLTVKVDRLLTWCRPGLLCIGDAAHAMSPVGGVGINLAIQDAVATANLLSDKLLERNVTIEDLKQVQQRRLFPTRITQRAQVIIQNRVLGRALTDKQFNSPPWFIRLFKTIPFLQRIPAYMVGLGVRPEHIKSRNAFE
jgi:2-polyprenyl-6-methoxyphenol hydroxylase-like FAD-dependent oxidoreductase